MTRQLGLPLDLPAQPLPTAGGGGETTRDRPVKAVRYAQCPQHVPHGTRRDTAVIVDPAGRQVFRDHARVVGAGHRLRCPGSGQPAP